MIVNTRALNAIRGQGATPDVGDSNLYIPNIAVMTLPLRDPIRALDVPPGSASEGAAFSFNVFLDLLIAPSTPVGATNMGFLAPGLWNLFCSLNIAVDFALTPATTSNCGFAFIQPPAILASRFLSVFAGSNGMTAEITVELDTITQVIVVTQGTGAAQNCRMCGSFTANRLL